MSTAMDTKVRSESALGAAREAARFIDGLSAHTEHGIVWGISEERPGVQRRDLYAGSGGIAIFLLELWQATVDEAFLDQALACGRDLAAAVEDKEIAPCAMFSGWAGDAFALIELAKEARDPTLREQFEGAARLALTKLRRQSSEVGAGRGFVEPMPFSDITGFTGDREIYDASVGAAGVGLVCLRAGAEGVDAEGVAFATMLGERLLEVAEPMETGLQWGLMNDMPFPFTAPNFAHGGAGVGFFLARLHQATGDPRYLEAAEQAARHLMAIAFPAGDGRLICHLKEGKNPNERYYLGQCHGPPGTSRLFDLLHTITGDPAWLEFSRALLRGLLATGAPEQRSYGLWNNVSQCCCDAGIGDYALFTYRAHGDEQALDLALRTADELERRATKDERGWRWPQAEHRMRPDFVETQTGYMQGAAGIGSFFVHLATALRGDPKKIVFPDNPFDVLSTSHVGPVASA